MGVTVVDPTELLAALQANLQGIDALVALLKGDPANIHVYGREGNLAGEISTLTPPLLLIYWDGIQPTKFPAKFRYLVAIVIRAKNPAAIFQALCEGVSSFTGGDGQPLLVSTIHPRFSPMELPTLERQQIAVTSTGDAFEVFVLRTAYSDKASN